MTSQPREGKRTLWLETSLAFWKEKLDLESQSIKGELIWGKRIGKRVKFGIWGARPTMQSRAGKSWKSRKETNEIHLYLHLLFIIIIIFFTSFWMSIRFMICLKSLLMNVWWAFNHGMEYGPHIFSRSQPTSRVNYYSFFCGFKFNSIEYYYYYY